MLDKNIEKDMVFEEEERKDRLVANKGNWFRGGFWPLFHYILSFYETTSYVASTASVLGYKPLGTHTTLFHTSV